MARAGWSRFVNPAFSSFLCLSAVLAACSSEYILFAQHLPSFPTLCDLLFLYLPQSLVFFFTWAICKRAFTTFIDPRAPILLALSLPLILSLHPTLGLAPRSLFFPKILWPTLRTALTLTPLKIKADLLAHFTILCTLAPLAYILKKPTRPRILVLDLPLARIVHQSIATMSEHIRPKPTSVSYKRHTPDPSVLCPICHGPVTVECAMFSCHKHVLHCADCVATWVWRCITTDPEYSVEPTCPHCRNIIIVGEYFRSNRGRWLEDESVVGPPRAGPLLAVNHPLGPDRDWFERYLIELGGEGDPDEEYSDIEDELLIDEDLLPLVAGTSERRPATTRDLAADVEHAAQQAEAEADDDDDDDLSELDDSDFNDLSDITQDGRFMDEVLVY